MDDNVADGEPLLYQVDPWHAPVSRTGPLTFTVSGDNFPAGSDGVTVTFGDAEALVQEVT